MKTRIGILLVVLLITGGLGSLVYAEDESPGPDNNSIHFETHYWYGYTPAGDTFTNKEVGGSMFWAANMVNNHEITGRVMSELDISLAPPFDVEWNHLGLDPSTAGGLVEVAPPGPPYEWSSSDIEPYADVAIMVYSVDPSAASVDYEPGFDVTRWVDKTTFSGPQTQALTVVVTPREDYLSGPHRINNIIIHVAAGENQLIPGAGNDSVDAQIQPLPGDNWFSSADGQLLVVGLADWETGKPITIEVDILVTPTAEGDVEYMPTVWVFEVVEEPTLDAYGIEHVYGEPYQATSHTIAQPPLGSWTWTIDMGEGEADPWITWRANVLLKGITFSSVHPGVESFSIETMSVDFDRRPSRDKISITEATFSLREGATYDLAVDDVTVMVDGVVITIPAGSFTRDDDDEGEYEFKSDEGDGPKVHMEIDFDKGEWSLKVSKLDASVIDNSDGVTVVFSIGSSAAIERIHMQVGGLSYTAND